MRHRLSLLTATLFLLTIYLPLFSSVPAKAQTFKSPGMRFGLNVSPPQYTEYAYTDVFMEALGWSNVPSYTANHYPTTGTVDNYGVNIASLNYCLLGDPPGANIYHFYGEGIFSIFSWNGNFNTNNTFVPGTLSVLPPNYPGNLTSSLIGVPANFAGNNPSPIRVWLNNQYVTIPANTPPNPLPIFLWIPPNSPANNLSVPVTTCDVQYTIPARVTGGYSLITSLPLSWLIISNINPQGLPNQYPNNFHMIRPGYPAWQSGNSFYPITANSYPIFTKEYLNSFAPFCAIRFMGWMEANYNTGLSWQAVPKTNPVQYTLANSGPYSWVNRPPFNGGQYIGCGNGAVNVGGACYENMIALCNATGCDMWVSVPLQATDDWKTGFANLVANDPVYRLNPWLHCYYEHGNELWNWSFIGWQLVNIEAIADGLGPGWSGHGEEMGKLLMSDVNDMQPILGSMGRPILAGQYADPTDYCGGGLTYIQKTYGPPKNYIYGIAGAPYFYDLTTTSMNTLTTQMIANMKLANQYGIYMCAYEAGQSLPSTPQATFDANNALQETSAMVSQHWAEATMWQQNGGDLCMWFTRDNVWSQYGFWGVLPLGSYMDDLSDPACMKYNAMAAMNNYFSCNCGNAAPPPTPNNTGKGNGQGSNNSNSSGNSNSSSTSNNNGSSNNTAVTAPHSGSTSSGTGWHGDMRGFFGGPPRGTGGN